ncbi:hypothetical protein QUA81_25105 [Microcoleus sp. F6_B4]
MNFLIQQLPSCYANFTDKPPIVQLPAVCCIIYQQEYLTVTLSTQRPIKVSDKSCGEQKILEIREPQIHLWSQFFNLKSQISNRLTARTPSL